MRNSLYHRQITILRELHSSLPPQRVPVVSQTAAHAVFQSSPAGVLPEPGGLCFSLAAGNACSTPEEIAFKSAPVDSGVFDTEPGPEPSRVLSSSTDPGIDTDDDHPERAIIFCFYAAMFWLTIFGLYLFW